MFKIIFRSLYYDVVSCAYVHEKSKRYILHNGGPYMMLRAVSGILIAGYSLLSAATNDTLSGTVKDGSGTAIAGAVVSLAKQATLKGTTDDKGVFIIAVPTSGTAIPFGMAINNAPQIGIHGKQLQFLTSSKCQNATISLFRNNGSLLSTIRMGSLNAGVQQQSLPELAAGFYIVQVALDGIKTTVNLISNGRECYLNDAQTGISSRVAKSAAVAASIDTLIASKSGYETTKVAVDSYAKKDVAIVMKSVAECPTLKLPSISAITYSNAKHPDAFTFKYMDLPKVTTKAQWECRRQEILAMAQDYMYGHLPPKCEVVGTVSGGTITAKCTYNGKTANVSVNASGSGDILVLEFGMGAPKPANSRSASMAGSSMLTIAKSLFGTTDMGICMASAWGVGRIIDALEQNPNSGISAKKVVTTGCSTNGKQALIAGVFEPRVALCVPVESGAAGSCSWRVSKKYGNGNSNTDCQDITHLETNWTGTITDNTWEKGTPSIDKLPFDQGELMALRAPGATMAFNNYKEWKWLCARGNVAAAQSCHWIYKALGVSDNFGFAESKSDHGHCTWPSEHTSQLNAFYDKFLNGKTDANTKVMQWHSSSEETSLWFEFGKGKDQWDTTLVLE
jgi:hypothetical protein